eukprot:g1896.t1
MKNLEVVHEPVEIGDSAVHLSPEELEKLGRLRNELTLVETRRSHLKSEIEHLTSHLDPADRTIELAKPPRDYSLSAYFAKPWYQIFRERLPWLATLLLIESVSVVVLENFNSVLRKNPILLLFAPMLVGTAGNSGNQPGVVVTRALSSGELDSGTATLSFVKREAKLAIMTGLTLSVIAFFRTSVENPHNLMDCLAISIALFFIVLLAITLGISSSILLYRIGFDPAAGAAPLLTTCSDVLGITALCIISSMLLDQ